MADLTELRKTTERLAAIDERRASLVEYRDRQIVAALDAGETWSTVQEASGLTPRGVQLAVRRAKAADGVTSG